MELFDKTLEHIKNTCPEVLNLRASKGAQIATIFPIFNMHDPRLGIAINSLSVNEFIDAAMALVLTDGASFLVLLRYCSSHQFYFLNEISNFNAAVRALKFDETDVEAFLNHHDPHTGTWIYQSKAFAPAETIEAIVTRINPYDILRIKQISPLALVISLNNDQLAAIACYLEKDQIEFIARHADFTKTIAVKEKLVEQESPLIEPLLEALEFDSNFIHLHPKQRLEDELILLTLKVRELLRKIDLDNKPALKLLDSLYFKTCVRLHQSRLKRIQLVSLQEFIEKTSKLKPKE